VGCVCHSPDFLLAFACQNVATPSFYSHRLAVRAGLLVLDFVAGLGVNVSFGWGVHCSINADLTARFSISVCWQLFAPRNVFASDVQTDVHMCTCICICAHSYTENSHCAAIPDWVHLRKGSRIFTRAAEFHRLYSIFAPIEGRCKN